MLYKLTKGHIMVRNTIRYAKSEDYRNLAKKLIAKRTSREDTLAWLKGNKYIVNNVKYQAVEVVTLMQLWEDISEGIKAGAIKASKAKGLTINTK